MPLAPATHLSHVECVSGDWTACTLVPQAEARELHLLHVIPDPFRVPGLDASAGIDYYAEVERSWKER